MNRLDKRGSVFYYSSMQKKEEMASLAEINDVWDYYKKDLMEVEDQLRKNLDSKVLLINKASNYILDSGGKRIRPLLMIISSGLFGYTSKEVIVLAGIIEFIHTATLLHDDVIDNSDLRRGKKAVRTIWGNQPSILIGDYLYTRALSKTISLEVHEINYTVSQACTSMLEGEVLQFYHNGNINITEEEYLNIIEHKTAALLSAACRLGAIAGGAKEEEKDAISRFGLKLGTAFQVADDTLDYVADKEKLGKSMGKDLNEGKITMPLLHLLRHCDSSDKKKLMVMIETNSFEEKDLHYILSLMKEHGSIDYSLGKAKYYIEEAKKELPVFEDSPHKKSLSILADYVATRDY